MFLIAPQVCENIVIPNTRLREDAEEMFEFNWLEYVRQDTEGSDADTRRRAACELVRALTDKFPAEVTRSWSRTVIFAKHRSTSHECSLPHRLRAQPCTGR